MRKTFFAFAAAVMIMTGCSQKPAQEHDCANKGAAAIENIMNRKSVRSFTGEAISEEDMTTMLKAAMAAPSGMNIQPWSFVVLTDASKFDDIFQGNFNVGTFKSAGTVVVMCADTTTQSRGSEERVPNSMWRDDLGASTENFLLAAEALGLGAVWTAGYPFMERIEHVKEALGLPAEVLPYCMIAVGHPDGENQPKDKFKADRIHYGKW